MILRMFYREDPVMDISVIDSPGEFIVQSWNILCPDLLPEELKPAFAYTEYKGLQQNTLDQWINQRAIPDYRENIDDCLLSLYHLPYHLFGRMYRYQHTAALLPHFASGFDDYVLSLTKTEIICYAPIDPRLINLYRLRPIEKDEWYMRKQNPVCAADECLKKRIDIPIPYENQCIPSISYTIPSSVPSWLERGTKGLVLKQKLSEWNQGELRNRAEFLIEYGEKHAFAGKRCLSDNQFCTDFSDISECDVSFLQSFLPYMKPCEDFWEQLKTLIPEYVHPVIQPISKLMKTAKEKNISISPAEIGIACQKRKKDAFPIVIL